MTPHLPFRPLPPEENRGSTPVRFRDLTNLCFAGVEERSEAEACLRLLLVLLVHGTSQEIHLKTETSEIRKFKKREVIMKIVNCSIT